VIGFILGPRSLLNLRGVHPDLVRVVKHAIRITDIDFTVLEGLRTRARQELLFKQGATRTLNSRHLTGHAVDIAPWINRKPSWHWPHYDVLSESIKIAAAQEHVPLTWGGDWATFRDGPHWELPRKDYP
jgi:peptidoglycan L-alanyl-D-glutamate endopeptidase CwlK